MQNNYLKLKNQLEKVVINTGIGRLAVTNTKFKDLLGDLKKEFAAITGQTPAETTAKKSISGFKLREGVIIGLKATLRGKRMVLFLDKFIKVALPRLRDFRGINKKSVDKNGNLSIGLKEHTIFPEINLELSKVDFGLEITIVPKMRSREKALVLYTELGIPWQKNR